MVSSVSPLVISLRFFWMDSGIVDKERQLERSRTRKFDKLEIDGGSVASLVQSFKYKVRKCTKEPMSNGSWASLLQHLKSSIASRLHWVRLFGSDVIDLHFRMFRSSSDVQLPISRGNSSRERHFNSDTSTRLVHKTMDSGRLDIDLHSRRERHRSFLNLPIDSGSVRKFW